jgi:hypothetical protein
MGAINGMGDELLITASPASDDEHYINLIHRYYTVRGNQTITEDVTPEGFVVKGMSGGAGGDCKGSQICRSNEDCDSYVCIENVCQ